MATRAETKKLKEVAEQMGVVADGKTYENLMEEVLASIEAVPPEDEAKMLTAETIEFYNLQVEIIDKAKKAEDQKTTTASPASTPVPAAVAPPAATVVASKPPVVTSTAPPAPKEKKVSSYPIVIEAIFKNPEITKVELAALIASKGLDTKPATLDIQFSDIRRVYGVVKSLDLLK